MSFDMIQGAKDKYLGKRYHWRGREIQIIHCFSCYEGCFFEYHFTEDVHKQIYRISMFDEEFMGILEEEKNKESP